MRASRYALPPAVRPVLGSSPVAGGRWQMSTADGQRFLTMKAGEDARERGRAELVVVQNWLPRIRRGSETGQ